MIRSNDDITTMEPRAGRIVLPSCSNFDACDNTATFRTQRRNVQCVVNTNGLCISNKERSTRPFCIKYKWINQSEYLSFSWNERFWLINSLMLYALCKDPVLTPRNIYAQQNTCRIYPFSSFQINFDESAIIVILILISLIWRIKFIMSQLRNLNTKWFIIFTWRSIKFRKIKIVWF